MDDRAPGPRSVPLKGSAEDRLQSWKEIASYLGRDPRSVSRWEKTEQLPIHRHQHGKHGSVYAYRSELDAWIAARSGSPRPREHRPMWRFWAAGAGACVIVTLGAIGLLHRRNSATELPLAVPFTSSRGVELQPALSPDSRQVAFAWNGDNRQNYDIYVKVAPSGPILQLTRDPADEYSPAWSPDGRSIAFLRRKDPDHVTVAIVPASGSTERVLTELSSGARIDWSRPGPFLTWSLDGKWLVASGQPPDNATDRLVRISVASGEVLPITTPPPGMFGDFAPALAPDGNRLAFIRRVSWATSELYVLPVSADLMPGGDLIRFDTGAAWNASPAWTPDGKALIFSTGTMASPHLAKIAASGKNGSVRLAGIGESGWQPSLGRTHDGKVRLVYTRHFESVNIWRQQIDRRGSASELITSAHRSYEPDYSPDSSHIAFLSDISGYVEIWVAQNDGSDLRQWTFLQQASLGAPRWSPDGRRIAFTMPGAGGSSIFWIDGPAAGARPVADSTPSGYLTWAPDGASIYFTTNRGQGSDIWKIKLEGGSAARVTTRSGRVPAISADGQFLFFQRMVDLDGAVDLFQVPLAGGDERRLLSYVDAYSVCRGGVAYKYYRPGPKSEGPRIQFYRFGADGAEYTIETTKPLRYGVAVSPDCRYVLYSQVDYEVSDLMLAEGLK